MLKGIDVSSWQGDIQVQNMPVDFVIVKATEGTGYVNPYCDSVYQRAKNAGKLLGFYMWLKDAEPLAQADYFVDNCLNYFGEAIPCIDWEEGETSVNRVNACARRIHERTGVWPLIYSWPRWFNKGGVEPNCGRWIASYPSVTNPDLDYIALEMPAVDGLVAMWQYASDGRVSGYNGDLDLNHFYGDEKAWKLYAGVKIEESEEKTVDNLVIENPKKITIEY